MKATTPLPSRTQSSRRTGTTAAAKGNGAPALKLKSILVPIDFSPPSMKALDYAVNLAANTRAQITLIHVLEMVAMPEFAGYPLVLPTDATVQTTRAELTRVARQHGCEGPLLSEIKVRKGTPYHEITLAARSLKADLIVIATHGYTGVKRVLLGSTAERVVRHAACPVLVIPARG